jgi:hypothetical protein
MPTRNDDLERHVLPLAYATRGGGDTGVRLHVFGGRILTEAGYRVMTTCRGADALNTFIVHHRRIDLVLSSASLPDVSFAGLRVALFQIAPQVPVAVTDRRADTQSYGDRGSINSSASAEMLAGIRRHLPASPPEASEPWVVPHPGVCADTAARDRRTRRRRRPANCSAARLCACQRACWDLPSHCRRSCEFPRQRHYRSPDTASQCACIQGDSPGTHVDSRSIEIDGTSAPRRVRFKIKPLLRARETERGEGGRGGQGNPRRVGAGQRACHGDGREAERHARHDCACVQYQEPAIVGESTERFFARRLARRAGAI